MTNSKFILVENCEIIRERKISEGTRGAEEAGGKERGNRGVRRDAYGKTSVVATGRRRRGGSGARGRVINLFAITCIR